MMYRLLVTGGAGFVGSNFTRSWLRDYPRDKVIVLDALTYAGNMENLASVLQNPNFSFVRGDIRNVDIIKRILIEESIDIVVNFASESHVDRSILRPQAFIESNIIGVFTLLESIRQCWSKPFGERRLIQASTAEVYGSLKPNSPPFTEASPYKPNSPYAASKAAGDHLAFSYCRTYGLPVILTNCSSSYGPYQFPEKLIPLAIINALEQKPIPVYGNGKNIRDWIYVEDYYRGLKKVIEHGAVGETYNIGGNCQKNNIDVVKMICDYIDEFKSLRDDKSSHNLITFVEDRPGHDFRHCMNTAKTKWDLGWMPIEIFETGLYKTIKWYLQNQDWLQRVRSGNYRIYYQEQYGKRLIGKDNIE